MKTSILNIIITLLTIAVCLVLIWIMPVKGTLFCVFILQIITLLAIGGTNFNISNYKDNADHEQEEKTPYQGEEEV